MKITLNLTEAQVKSIIEQYECRYDLYWGSESGSVWRRAGKDGQLQYKEGAGWLDCISNPSTEEMDKGYKRVDKP